MQCTEKEICDNKNRKIAQQFEISLRAHYQITNAAAAKIEFPTVAQTERHFAAIFFNLDAHGVNICTNSIECIFHIGKKQILSNRTRSLSLSFSRLKEQTWMFQCYKVKMKFKMKFNEMGEKNCVLSACVRLWVGAKFVCICINEMILLLFRFPLVLLFSIFFRLLYSLLHFFSGCLILSF